MSFLKKLGQVLGVVTQVVLGFGPLVTALTPTKKDDAALPVVTDTLQQVAGLVVTAEAIGQQLGIPGPDKLRGITPLVAQAILQAKFMTGQKIHDPVLFQKGCAEVGAGVADILNSLKDDEIKVEDRT